MSKAVQMREKQVKFHYEKKFRQSDIFDKFASLCIPDNPKHRMSLLRLIEIIWFENLSF